MAEHENMEPDELMIEIYRALWAALEQKVHLIGSVLDADSRREIQAEKIYDKGDFYGNTGYVVQTVGDTLVLRIGSNVRHEPFVLGGKVPSWTPIAPLIGWVGRKQLSWVDKRSGKALSIEQMAYMIRAKIKREGIEPRNVFATVVANREEWISQQIDNIGVRL